MAPTPTLAGIGPIEAALTNEAPAEKQMQKNMTAQQENSPIKVKICLAPLPPIAAVPTLFHFVPLLSRYSP